VTNDSRALALLDFVRRNLIPEDAGEIGLDTPLLSERLIDSMGIAMLAAFIEEEFDVPFDGTELRKGRVESIRAIVGRLGPAP
jgi:acyl carrier protein